MSSNKGEWLFANNMLTTDAKILLELYLHSDEPDKKLYEPLGHRIFSGISKELGLPTSTLANAMDRLEKQGYVSWGKVESSEKFHNNLVRYKLTESGMSNVEDFLTKIREFDYTNKTYKKK